MIWSLEVLHWVRLRSLNGRDIAAISRLLAKCLIFTAPFQLPLTKYCSIQQDVRVANHHCTFQKLAAEDELCSYDGTVGAFFRDVPVSVMRPSVVCEQRCLLSNKEDVQSVYQQPKPHTHVHTQKIKCSPCHVSTGVLSSYETVGLVSKVFVSTVRSAYVSSQQPHSARTPTCARRTNQTLPPVSVHHYKHLSVTGKGSASWVVQGPELWTVLWIQRSLLDIHKKDKDIK